MSIEFRAENHRSLRDEQSLTLEAARLGDGQDARPRQVAGHGERLLPAAVIYGANASGKTNVLSAMSFMREAVVLSHRLWEPEGGIPRSPFGWGPRRAEPSLFQVLLLIAGTKYEYGFVVGDQEVKEEWLYAWPSGKKQAWFERDEGGDFTFGRQLKGENQLIKDVTRPNALFLSVAAQHKHRQLLPIYGWFRTIAPVNLRGRRYASPYARPFFAAEGPGTRPTAFGPGDDYQQGEAITDRIWNLLKAADTGIACIKVVSEEQEVVPGPRWRRRILFQHQADDENAWLEVDDESHGTQRLFWMSGPIFQALETGGLLLVDEFESSLHPLLGQAIVRLFNNPRTNPRNGQILFTTHDTNLLGTTLGEPPLRRDQIWFTEKDRGGATKLYPLTDYKPRKAENLERGYLQGRYGAVPFLGDIAWITE